MLSDMEAVKQTTAFKALHILVQAGYKLELLDVDCPSTIEVTAETFQQYIVEEKPRFGHTWALAAALLDLFKPETKAATLPLPKE